MASDRIDPFAADHPVGRDRVANLETEVEASPYKDVPEDPAVEHQYEMLQAKLAGYIEPMQTIFNRYPLSDTSKPARYARAMAYSRKPDLPKALAEINSLIKDEPNNPYFYEVLGQIYVSMAKPALGVAAYQSSVDLMPDAPQLRVALAAAQLATEKPELAKPALDNLKISLQQEDDDSFAWYEAAQAYSMIGQRADGGPGDGGTLLCGRRHAAGGAVRGPGAPRPDAGLAGLAARERHRRGRGAVGSHATTLIARGHAMNAQWKIAALGVLGGAALALVLVFGASALGLLPQKAALDGKQLRGYLLGHPELIVDMTNRLQAQQAIDADREQQASMRAIGMKAFFDPRIAFVTGPENAKATLVEFFDYNCPYCRASVPALKKYYDAHKNDTRFSFIEFPIKGPNSVIAARASLAARKQPDKYLAFHFALMGEEALITEDIVFADAAKVGLDVARLKRDMQDGAIDQAIDIAHKLAVRAKIDGTPTFVINGHLRPGAVDGDALNRLIRHHLAWRPLERKDAGRQFRVQYLARAFGAGHRQTGGVEQSDLHEHAGLIPVRCVRERSCRP